MVAGVGTYVPYRQDRHSRALHASLQSRMQPRVDGYAPRAPTPAASRAQCVPLRRAAITRCALSPLSPLACRRRERQLSELCASVSGTRPLNGEASLLETPVGTKDGGALALRMCVRRRGGTRAGALTRTHAAQSAAAWVPRRAAGADGARGARRAAQGVSRGTFAPFCVALTRLGAPPAQVTAPVQHPWVDPATRRVDYSSCAPLARACAAASLR